MVIRQINGLCSEDLTIARIIMKIWRNGYSRGWMYYGLFELKLPSINDKANVNCPVDLIISSHNDEYDFHDDTTRELDFDGS